MLRRFLLAHLAFVGVHGLAAAQTVIYVDSNASRGGDGRTWATVYRELRAAVTVAGGSAGSVEQIWVADGVYRPASDGDRSASFELVGGVEIYGGFDGTDSLEYPGGETSIDQRNPETNVTVGGCLFTENTASLLGGGIYCENVLASVGVTGSTFVGNTCLGNGGGMYTVGPLQPTLASCSFVDNTAAFGGGLYVVSSGSPSLTDCTFTGNSATTSEYAHGGGGVRFDGQGTGSPSLVRCSFVNNTAVKTGGAAYVRNCINMLLDSCTFRGNSGSQSAGGVKMVNTSESLIANCGFFGNSAANGGALLFADDLASTIVNSIFSGNTSDSLAFGAGGAGVFVTNGSTPSFLNCTFSQNAAANIGGGMMNSMGSAPVVHNCILWGNTENNGLSTDEFAQIHDDPLTGGADTTVTYSNVQGLTIALAGPGNIGFDELAHNPRFVDAGDDDIHLGLSSPCIDAGDPTFMAMAGNVDLDGEARLTGMRIDMGADEHHDCNGSGVTDYFELDMLGEPDCNDNRILDQCEENCDQNGVVDACEEDCNENGQADSCDIANGLAGDCNSNGVPDGCEEDLDPTGQHDLPTIIDLAEGEMVGTDVARMSGLDAGVELGGGRGALAFGDFNGDGRDDLIVGAVGSTIEAMPDVGEAFVTYGCGLLPGASVEIR